MDGKGGVTKINSHIAKVNAKVQSYIIMVPSFFLSCTFIGECYQKLIFLLLKDGGCVLESIDKPEFSLMGNFLCSEGQPGKVLIYDKHSTSQSDKEKNECFLYISVT